MNSTQHQTLSFLWISSKHVCNFILSFLQPAAGTPIPGKDVVICKFPSDPTLAMGSLSIWALVVAAIVGHVAIFFPYSGKSVPRGALFQSTSLTVFFIVAEWVHFQLYNYKSHVVRKQYAFCVYITSFMWRTCWVLLPFSDIELQTDPSKFCIPELSSLTPKSLYCVVFGIIMLINAKSVKLPI